MSNHKIVLCFISQFVPRNELKTQKSVLSIEVVHEEGTIHLPTFFLFNIKALRLIFKIRHFVLHFQSIFRLRFLFIFFNQGRNFFLHRVFSLLEATASGAGRPVQTKWRSPQV